MRGVVHVVFVDHEHLTEVVGLARLSQYLALQVTQGGIIPAGAAAMLVLNACYRVLLDSRKHLFGCRV